MKFFTRFILIFFILFLSAPTLISFVKEKTDIVFFYSLDDDELQKDCNEIVADINQNFDLSLRNFKNTFNIKIISENLSRHDNVSEKIFSPPPELI